MSKDKGFLILGKRYKNGELLKKKEGVYGSVKADVYNPVTRCVFIYKFDDESLGHEEIEMLKKHMPEGKHIDITEVKPQKDS
jgi:hypothetical protein